MTDNVGCGIVLFRSSLVKPKIVALASQLACITMGVWERKLTTVPKCFDGYLKR